MKKIRIGVAVSFIAFAIACQFADNFNTLGQIAMAIWAFWLLEFLACACLNQTKEDFWEHIKFINPWF